jgi:hypothetical protein
MASITKEFMIEASPDRIWDALRDFGALHTRLVPGFVTDCRLEDGARVVTFGNGLVVREVLVGIDERTRRLSYTVAGGGGHHNASAQVFADGPARTRFVWITDVLPDDRAPAIDAMMEQGAAAMKKKLES